MVRFVVQTAREPELDCWEPDPWSGPKFGTPSEPNRESSSRFSKFCFEPDRTGLWHPYFTDAFDENFNFSDYFWMALRWDVGKRGSVVCLTGRARSSWLRSRLLVLLLKSWFFLQYLCCRSLERVINCKLKLRLTLIKSRKGPTRTLRSFIKELTSVDDCNDNIGWKLLKVCNKPSHLGIIEMISRGLKIFLSLIGCLSVSANSISTSSSLRNSLSDNSYNE